jgi:peptide/nickel transport system permease protein
VTPALLTPVRALAEGGGSLGRQGPWRLAARRLRRDRGAIAAGVLLILIVVSALAAPLYADHIANTNPFTSNILGTVEVDGKQKSVIQTSSSGLGTIPIGPTLEGRYLLGADSQGRDVAARLLYGGRTSLLIGICSALIACVVATVLALIAGFFRGLSDIGLSRAMDVVWAFPVYLIAICIATVLLTQGIRIGFIQVNPGSVWLPTLIIGIVFVPYVFRPVRAHVLSVREKDYIEAAMAQGATDRWLLFSEILPNVIGVVIMIFPLMIAQTILAEAALSYLGIGVQPPNASWGTIINDGEPLLYIRPLVSIAPGVMIVLTVLALNVLGNSIRQAIDPRARVRIGR